MSETPTLTVTDVKRHEARAGETALALGGLRVAGRPGMWTATVTREGRGAFGHHERVVEYVSRRDDETEWHVDALSRDGLPVWANGAGARVTVAHLVDRELARELDGAVQVVEALEAVAAALGHEPEAPSVRERWEDAWALAYAEQSRVDEARERGEHPTEVQDHAGQRRLAVNPGDGGCWWCREVEAGRARRCPSH